MLFLTIFTCKKINKLISGTILKKESRTSKINSET
jgi:hypothetical protein